MGKNCDKCGKSFGLMGKSVEYTNGTKYCPDCSDTLEKQADAKSTKEALKVNSAWEYKFVSIDTKPGLLMAGASIDSEQLEEFNTLGALGWELASTIPLLGYKPAIVGSGRTTTKIMFVFKRKKGRE